VRLFKPAGFAWLLAHDLRQSWRGFLAVFGTMRLWKIVLILALVTALLHLIAAGVVLVIAPLRDDEALSGWFAAGAFATLTWMIAQGMTGAMRSLYARGDFDLLFASPISPLVVLAPRALAVAVEGAASSLLLIGPLADMGALLGHPGWLAIYPALISSAFFGAGLGLAIALGLFVAVGPRRARMFSQVGATMVGASFVLSAQIVNMLPTHWRDAVFAGFAAPSKGSWLSRDGALFLPARAAEGDGRALLLWAIASVAVFVIAVLVCAPVFAEAAAAASGAPAGGNGQRTRRAFRAGVQANLRAKERRLVWRDPWLLSQILMQILYTLPLSVVLWRNGGITGSPAIAFAPSLVVIAAQMAGALAWVALSGEDAPDFLASAPVTRRDIDRGKLEAIAAPILCVVALPLLGLALASPFGAAMALLFGAGASASSALVNLWRQAPAPRRMVLRRHAQSKLVGLIEHAVSFLWAIACALAIFGSWTALVPLAVAVFALWLTRRRAARPAAAPA
jgi:ABC-2 type transport system permease protein